MWKQKLVIWAVADIGIKNLSGNPKPATICSAAFYSFQHVVAVCVCVCVSASDGSCSCKVLDYLLILLSNQWEHRSLRVHRGVRYWSKNNKALWDMSAKSQAKKNPEALLMLCESVFLWLHPHSMSFGHWGTCSPLLNLNYSRWPMHTENVRWEMCSDYKITLWHWACVR